MIDIELTQEDYAKLERFAESRGETIDFCISFLLGVGVITREDERFFAAVGYNPANESKEETK